MRCWNVELGLDKTIKQFSQSNDLVSFHMSTTRRTSFNNEGGLGSKGDLLGSMVVQLKTADKRNVRTSEFIKAWKANIQVASGLDKSVN